MPIKAAKPPSLAIPTATLAGAPLGAFLKEGASDSETPPTFGTKSINIPPKQTTSCFFSWHPLFLSTTGVLNEPLGEALGEPTRGKLV